MWDSAVYRGVVAINTIFPSINPLLMRTEQMERSSRMLRPLEESGYQDFQKYLKDVLPFIRAGKKKLSSPDVARRLATLAIDLVSCFKGFDQRSRFEMLKEIIIRNKEIMTELRILQEHFKSLTLLAVQEAKNQILGNPGSDFERSIRGLREALLPSVFTLRRWTEHPSCEKKIKEYLSKPFGFAQYLDLESELFWGLVTFILKSFDEASERGTTVYQHLETFTGVVGSRALDYVKTHLNDPTNPAPVHRNLLYFLRKHQVKRQGEVVTESMDSALPERYYIDTNASKISKISMVL